MRVLNKQVLTAADIASNQASIAFESDWMLSVSAQAVLTGTNPTGTLKFQGSNDIIVSGSHTPFVPTNWNDIGTPLAISAIGTYLMPTFDICYAFIRLIWTKTSGTGTITASIKTSGE